MTESDFMVVECACRQMGQKVWTSVQQKLLDVSPANYPCTCSHLSGFVSENDLQCRKRVSTWFDFRRGRKGWMMSLLPGQTYRMFAIALEKLVMLVELLDLQDVYLCLAVGVIVFQNVGICRARDAFPPETHQDPGLPSWHWNRSRSPGSRSPWNSTEGLSQQGSGHQWRRARGRVIQVLQNFFKCLFDFVFTFLKKRSFFQFDLDYFLEKTGLSISAWIVFAWELHFFVPRTL